jgi:hypothetical protein
VRQQKVRRRPARKDEVSPVSEEPPPARPGRGPRGVTRLLKDIDEVLSRR